MKADQVKLGQKFRIPNQMAVFGSCRTFTKLKWNEKSGMRVFAGHVELHPKSHFPVVDENNEFSFVSKEHNIELAE